VSLTHIHTCGVCAGVSHTHTYIQESRFRMCMCLSHTYIHRNTRTHTTHMYSCTLSPCHTYAHTCTRALSHPVIHTHTLQNLMSESPCLVCRGLWGLVFNLSACTTRCTWLFSEIQGSFQGCFLNILDYFWGIFAGYLMFFSGCFTTLYHSLLQMWEFSHKTL